MDQSSKIFDRVIEQRMNELQTPPPFGAWNRIAAELDAMPMAAPAPVNNLIPKRAIASFIAGMLIMGSAIATGFWINSNINTDKNISGRNEVSKAASFSSDANGMNGQMNNAVKLNMPSLSPIAKLPLYNNIVSNRPVIHKAIMASATVKAPVTNPVVSANRIADVPTPIQAVTLPASDLKETYYFPPVDIITPEKCKTEVDETKMAKVEDAKLTTDDDRPKADQKKFKPHRRRPGWVWGNINRM